MFTQSLSVAFARSLRYDYDSGLNNPIGPFAGTISCWVEYLFNECGRTGMCRGKGYTGNPGDETENPNLRPVSEVPDGVLDRAGKVATIAAGPATGLARTGLLSISAAADYVELGQKGDYVKFGLNFMIDKFSFGIGDAAGGLFRTFGGAVSEFGKAFSEGLGEIRGSSPGFKLPACRQCLADIPTTGR